MNDEYQIRTGIDAMDRRVIYEYISQSYWAQGISPEILNRALENSLCFGVFTSDGQQVGFARAITDKATFAYLADIFILPEHQGKGLGKWLVQSLLAHPTLQGLRRSMLATKDAHGLYKQFGFQPLTDTSIFMEAWVPDIYMREQ